MAILMEELEMKVKNEALDSFVLRAFDPGPLQTCKLCSIEFSLIAIHKKVFHSDNKEIRCAFCAMLFVSRKDLLDHLDEHRDGSDQFCCYCLIGQSSDDALTEHVETHRELHIFLCYKCRRTFATKSGLSGHDCVPDLAISYTKLEVSENSSAVVGEGDVESVRRVVKIEQRQVRLSESTFSENRAPRVLKSPGVPTQYSNRIIKLGEHRSTFSVTTTSNTNSIGSNGAVISLKTQSREDTNNCAVIDVKTGISPEKGDFFQDQNSIVEVTRTDESRRSPSVAVEFQEHQDPVIDGRSEVDRIGGSDSVTVKFESDSPIDIVLCSNHEAVMNENEDPLAVALAEEYRSTAGGVSHGGSAATSADTSTSSQGEFGCNDGSSFSTSMKVEAMDSCADTLSLSPGTTDKKSHSKANAGLPGTSDITSPVALPTPPSSQGDSGVDAYNLALQPPPVVEDLEKRILETDLPNTSLPSTTSQIENSTGKHVRIVRSRKRLHAATCDSVNEKMATPLEVQTHVEEPVEIRLAEESVAPTPPDSPPPSKKKRITFNETIEYWNPTLQERAWMELAEEFPEVREVPLLKVSSKKSKKKSKKKKKSSKSKKAQKSPVKETTLEHDLTSPSKPGGDLPSSELCTPTKLVLKPVLKPSPVPQVESPAPKPLTEQNVKRRGGSIPAHSDQLYKKFGHGFSYKKCLKVDGRYHCPDNDCRNNNDRGFATDNGIRYHIRRYHIEAPSFNCTKCDKSCYSSAKLKMHLLVHNSSDSYPCSICSKKFKSPYSLKYHEGLHTKPFQCFHCQKNFSRKLSVKTHLVPMRCDVCDVVVPCSNLFLRHEDDVPHLYECTGCEDKTFKRLREFNSHIRRFHYEETTALDGTWICNICQRKFTSRNIAMRHARRNHKTILKPATQVAARDS